VIVWRDVFLGVIAVATLAIAVAQIAVIVAAASAAKRLGEIADTFEREVRPLVGHLNAIGRDAARAAQLATAQVERADRMFADVAQRFEHTLAVVDASISAPAREGRALLSAFRAAFQALREIRRDGRGRQGRSDDEDALFI
jgi:archaellum biogenesis protein FlaJ (TadC family)